MKALTICQPYAHLVATGAKPIENRAWPTAYRGRLAIHAGKSRAWLAAEDDEVEHPGMVFGAVVAVATLYDCVLLKALPDLLAGHQHAYGPWCWLLRDVVRIARPIAVRGAQGLWDLPADYARELKLLSGDK